MGIDCGFDIYPRLDPTPENMEAYRRFLDEIIETYQHTYIDDDGSTDSGKLKKLLDVPDDPTRDPFIKFQIGEHPHLPCKPRWCYYFLRFSSKVSGRLVAANQYIHEVHEIASKHFGDRVHFWHDNFLDPYTPNEKEVGEAYRALKELASHE